MAFTESRLYNGRVYSAVSLIFLVIALTLLIVSASLHNLYRVSFDDIPEDVQSAYSVSISGSTTFGAFINCADMDGTVFTSPPSTFSLHSCASIPSNCRTKFTTVQDGVPVDIEDDPDANGFSCSQFNAFRAFLVIGIITLGLAIPLALASLTAYWQRAWSTWGAVGLLAAALVSVLISYALVGSLVTKTPANEYLSKGPAFALAVTAWCLMVVAAVVVRGSEVEWRRGEGRVVRQAERPHMRCLGGTCRGWGAVRTAQGAVHAAHAAPRREVRQGEMCAAQNNLPSGRVDDSAFHMMRERQQSVFVP